MSRLLLIDDDAMLREVLATELAQAGHSVVQADDGRLGARLFRVGRADLVITELVLPNHDGLGLIAELRREWPALPIIAMSGGSRSPLYLSIATKLGAQRALAKPFAPDVLRRVVDELLARRSTPPAAG